MKVMRCSNNNLLRPSFGLTVDFHADDMLKRGAGKGINLPNYNIFRDAMIGINMSPEAEYMRPSTVYLRHEAERKEPVKFWGIKIKSKIIDIWSAVAGDLKSEPFEIPRRKPNPDIIERKLSKAVREVCNKFCSDPLGDLVKTLNLKNTVI